MKFRAVKSSLLDGLQIVQSIVSTKTTLPVLGNVLFKTEDKKLYLTTTDLDITVRCGIEADIVTPGVTTLPARRLSNIVRELSDSEIEIDVDEDNKASVSCGSSFFKLWGLAEDEFPTMEEASGDYCYHIDQAVLKEMLCKTAYGASTDETRYVLNGVFMSFKGEKLTMVATDGRRLALVEQEVEFPEEAEIDIIVPSKTVTELIHTLNDEGVVDIHAQGNRAFFDFDDIRVASKLIDGTYPNYRQVIPSQCEERVAIERESLLLALRRVALLTSDKANATKLTFADNKLVISLDSPEVGEARETVPIKYDGKEITVAFNPEYMMDPLKTLKTDEVFIELTDDLSPGVIKCDTPFLYVLMPMRIS